MVKIPNMLEELVDYELVPADEDGWNVRILKGDYIESVISFGQIKVAEEEDHMKFDFTLEYSPDEDLTVEDLDFQKYVGKILESIMIISLENMENK